jgi:pyruvate/2-oxoacid:ferredoxin oxidoreductase alpha subunit
MATPSSTSAQGARHTIIVENNFSGQFARYLRSETSFVAHGHIRKYDGEPFMPHHIVEAVREQLAGKTKPLRANPRSDGVAQKVPLNLADLAFESFSPEKWRPK